MTQKLKKAENMVEAYQVFETQKPLTKDDLEFYVELYKKDISKLRKELILNPIPNKSFFVTGQSGNGKSTALNFLPDTRIEDKYDVKYLNGRDMFKLDDIDIIDVILMIGFTVVNGDKDLEKKYLEELEELKKVKLGKIQKERKERKSSRDEAGAKTSSGAKLSIWNLIKFDANIFAKYKIEKEKRDSIREIFTLDKQELIDKVNDIIEAYNAKVHQGAAGKLLIIIDDMEKIRDKEQAQDLFVDNHYVFDAIKSTKIVTFPVHLATKHPMYMDASKFGIRIDKSPYEESETEVTGINRKKLKDVILQRLADKTFIREDAIDMAVKFSGGNLRFLLKIIQNAFLNAIDIEDESATRPVVSTDVETGIEEMSSLASLSIMNRVKILKQVMDSNTEPDGEQTDDGNVFINSILDNTIFAYFNGHAWYDINPVMKKSVELYSKRSGQNSDG